MKLQVTDTQPKLVAFYHVAQLNDWQSVYDEQMQKLVSSGLYERLEKLYIGVNGDQPLPYVLPKALIKRNTYLQSERDTLKSVFEFACRYNDYKILYFHTKGVTQTQEQRKYVDSWRRYMEYFAIEKWNNTIKYLADHDTVGVEYKTKATWDNSTFFDFPHYSGNFWWANSSYIATLDPKFMDQRFVAHEIDMSRWLPEMWLLSNKQAKIKTMFQFDFPHVYGWYTEKSYRQHIKYSIVIPTYNHCDDLLRPCIESIIKTTDLTDVEIIISANGCTDNTYEYLQLLCKEFDEEGLLDHIRVVWNDRPLGYSKATNAGIAVARGEKIILHSNDVVLLDQEQNTWINLLSKPFDNNPRCGIVGIIKQHSPYIDRDFVIFFCVMIDRKVFDTIGLLNEEYGVGGQEDAEYCIVAEDAGFEVHQAVQLTWNHQTNMWAGGFPIYHKGEGTVHDKTLVPNWPEIFASNIQRLIKNYNQKIKYSIVIPTYNHCDDYLKPCVESIIKFTNMNIVELIISANGCTDNTREYVESLKIPHKKLVWSDQPLGYPKATNDGIKQAKGEYIVLLNNDTVLLDQPKNKWLQILREPFSDPQIQITGPQSMRCVYTHYWFTIFFCAMISRKLIDEIGLLEEGYYPGGSEDIDFCIRMQLKGYDHFTVSKFPLFHKGNGTFKDVDGYHEQILRTNGLKNCKKYNKNIHLKIEKSCEFKKPYINIDRTNVKAHGNMPEDCLDFDDQSISEVLVCAGSQELDRSKIQQYIDEWYRVLKPQGKLILEFIDSNRLFQTQHQVTSGEQLEKLYGLYSQSWDSQDVFKALDERFIVTMPSPQYSQYMNNIRMECLKK